MESDDYPRPITPVHPAAGYIGGKRRLSKHLVALIDAAPHTTYAEAFVGMGGVFLKRRPQPRAEVINDYSGDVANLFRILQRHYPQFMDTLRFQLSGRREFERLKATDPATLTDLERAGRFLYLQRLAFGGKVMGRNFGVDVRTPAAFDLNKLGPLLAELHERSRAHRREPALGHLHRPVRPAGDSVLPRPALLGDRACLRRSSIWP